MKTASSRTLVSSRKPARVTPGILAGSIATLVMALAGSTAQATTYYWDTNTTTAGSGATTGTWGTSTFWSTSSAGTNATANTAITSGDDVFFSAGTNGSTGTVTILTTQSAHSITFDDPVAVTLSGGTSITLGSATAGSGIFLTANGAATISTGVILNAAATALSFSNTGTSLLTIGAVTGNAAAAATQTVTVGSAAAGGITVGGVVGNGAAGGKVALTINNTSTGATTLSNANTFTGATNISAGSLVLTNAAGLGGTSGVTIASGAQLFFSGVGATFGSGQTLSLNGTGIGNAGALQISGTGTVAWGGAISLAGNASIHPNGGTTFNATGTINLGAFTLTSTLDGSSTNTFSNVVSGSGGLIKASTATLVLSGANTYTGATAVTGGVLSFNTIQDAGSATANALGTPAVGANSIIGLAGTLKYTGSAAGSSNRVINLTSTTGGATAIDASGSATLALSGGVTNAGTSGISALTLTGTGVGSESGTIVNGTGTNTASITKTAAGTWTLSGANTYTGTTTISAGTLKAGIASVAGVSGALGNNSALSMGNVAGATLDLNGFDTQVGSLTGGGTTGGNIILGSNRLTVGGDGTSPVTYGGVLSGTGGTLTKIGAGTLSLSGVNTFTGGISINAGSVTTSVSAAALGTGTVFLGQTGSAANASLNTGTTLLTYTNAITVASGAGIKTLANIGATSSTYSGLVTLDGNLTVNVASTGSMTLGAGGVNLNANTLAINSTNTGRFTTSGVISGTGAVTVAGSNTGDYVPNALHTYSGNTTLNSGFTALGVSSTGTGGTLVNGPFGTGTLILAGGQLRSGAALSANIGNAVTVSADTTFATVGSERSLTLNGPVTLDGSRTLTSLVGTTVAGTSVIINGAIGDGGSGFGITKAGAGNLTLGGVNTYSGNTTVSAGALYLTTIDALPGASTDGRFSFASGANLGIYNSLSEASVTTLLGTTNFAAGSGVVFDTTDGNRTYTSAIAGTQAALRLTKSGANILTLAGANAYTGTTTITAGTLTFANAGALYSGNTADWTPANLLPASGATLAVNIGGTGEFTDGQTDTLITQLSTVNNNGLKSGTNFGFDTTNASGDVTYSHVLANSTGTGSGAVGFTKLGTGTLILDQANTYTGSTTVANGTLKLTGNRTAAAGAVTVGNVNGQTGNLEISNGTFSVGTVTIGSGDSTAIGVITQTGGSVTTTGGVQLILGNSTTGTTAGTAASGTYNLSGGTLTGTAAGTRGILLGTNTGATGIFNLSGTGNLAMGASALEVGRSDAAATNTTGIFNQTGGTAAIGNLTIGGGAGATYAGTSGTLNLTGGTFSAAAFNSLSAGDTSTSAITIGGTAQVTLGRFPSVRGSGSTVSITFDGGTLIPAAANTDYLPAVAGTNAFLTNNGAKFSVGFGKDITVPQVLENAVASSGTLTKLGVGALTLTGANTYTGSTTVSAGTLTVAGSGTLAGTSGLSVGTGTRFTYLPTAPGTLNIGSGGTLNLANQSDIGASFGSTIAAGAATVGAVVNLVSTGAFVSTTPYSLLTASGGLSGATYNVLNPTNYTFTTTVSDTAVQITPTTAAALSQAYWLGGLSSAPSVWAASIGTASNWTTDGLGTATGQVPGAVTNVSFSDASASAGNQVSMSLGTDMAINSLTVNSSSDVSLLNSNNATLTLGSTTGSGITIAPGAGAVIINPVVIVGNAQTWTNNGSNGLTLASVTNGTGLLTLAGTGTTTITSLTGGTGGLTLSSGSTSIITAATLTGAQTWTNNGSTAFTVASLSNGANLLTLAGTGSTAITNLTGGTGGLTVSAGTTSITAATLTGAQTWTSNSTASGVTAGSVANGGFLLTTAGTGNEAITGVLSGTGGLTRTGTGTLSLSGANTYSGATIVNGGVLEISNSAGLGATSSGTTQSLTSELRLIGGISIGAEPLSINGGGISNLGALRNFSGDNIYGGTVTMAAQSRINSDSGTLTLSAANSVTSAGLSLIVGGAGNLTISGIAALGAGGIGKDGTGTLTFSGANTFTGATTISQGTIVMAGSSPTTSAIVVGNVAGNSVLNVPTGGSMTGTTITAGTLASAVGAVNVTGGSLSLSAPESTDTISFGAAEGGYGALTVSGGSFTQARFMFGGTGSTTTLGGVGVGLVTGGTVNTNGWVILGRAGASTGILTLTGGTINHAAASQVIAVGLAGSGRAELNVAGGLLDNTGQTVNYTGGTTGTFHWTGTGVVNLGAGTLLTNGFVYDSNAASANASSYLNFNGGTLKASVASATFLNAFTPTGTGINRVYVNGAFGSFAGGGTIDTNGFDTTISANLLAPTGNGATSLTITNAGSGYVGAPVVKILDNGVASSATGYAVVGTDPTNAATFGKVTNVVITNPGEITGTATVSLVGGGGTGAVISATTGANTSGGFTKTGAGVLTLTGASTYTGATTISAGTLQIGAGLAAGSLSGSSAIVNNAALVFNRSDVLTQGTHFGTISGTGTVTQAGGVSSTTTLNAANSYTGVTTISAGTLAIPSIDVVANANPLGKSSVAASNLVFNGGTLSFTGTTGSTDRGFTVSATSVLNLGTGGNKSLTFSGNITGAGQLTVSGENAVTNGPLNGASNVLTLSGNNSGFTGTLAISHGAVRVTNSNGLGSGTKNIAMTNGTAGSPSIQLDGTNGDISLPSTFTYNVSNQTINGIFNNLAGNNTVNGQINVGSGGGGFMATSTAGNLTIAANMTAATTLRAAFLQGASTGTFSGVISNGSTVAFAVWKAGTGTWTLSGANTFTGAVTAGEGTLSASSLNKVVGGTANSNLGAPTTAALGTIALGGGTVLVPTPTTTGTLRYTGTGETTDRVLNLAGTTGGGGVEQAGTGLLKFTSALTATGVGSKTLTLKGSTAGTGEIAAAIVDSGIGNTTSVTKTGTGAWTLSGTNSYTGLTSVEEGTLLVGGSIAGSVTVTGATAILSGAGSVASLSVQSGGTVAPGNGLGKLTVAGAFDLASGTHLSLQLNGTTPETGYDQILSTGNITLGGDLAGSSLGFTPAVNDVFYVIINNGAGTTTGTLGGVADGGSVFIGAQEFLVSYDANSNIGGVDGFNAGGDDVALLAVPEPTTMTLSMLMLGLLGLRERRSDSSRRRKA